MSSDSNTVEAITPLTIGESAPRFTLPAKPGEDVDIGALIGNEKLVLLFFPLAYSSVCTAELCHFRDQWTEWSGLGARVFGVSVDSPFVTDKFRQEEKVPFPILSDFNRTVAGAYGVLHEELFGLKGVAKRSAFVIGSDGRVAWTWVTDDPGVQVPFDDLRDAVESTV